MSSLPFFFAAHRAIFFLKFRSLFPSRFCEFLSNSTRERREVIHSRSSQNSDKRDSVQQQKMWGGGRGEDPFDQIFRRFGGPGFPIMNGFPASGSSHFSRSFGSGGGTFESTGRGFHLAATMIDTGKEYQIQLDAPGIPRDELKVTATNQKICVSGQRRPGVEAALSTAGSSSGSSTANKEQVILDERFTGFFERCFSFPHRIATDKITAHAENGVLSLSVSHSDSKDGAQEIAIK